MKIVLDFGAFQLNAELFEDHPVAQRYYRELPHTIRLTQWGGELYGPIDADLGTYHPVPVIPAGGLAYTNQGNYLCVFFGQTPAWAVEYIGRIEVGWEKLRQAKGLVSMEVKKRI